MSYLYKFLKISYLAPPSGFSFLNVRILCSSLFYILNDSEAWSYPELWQRVLDIFNTYTQNDSLENNQLNKA